MWLTTHLHGNAEAAYKDTLNYLEQHHELGEGIENQLWTYHELGDVFPQTLENFWSGHYFPYSESYYELQSSAELCLQGFYRYSFVGLRSVLELGILGVQIAINDDAHNAVKPWITSKIRTPSFRRLVGDLVRIPYFAQFDNQFKLREQLLKMYDDLGAMVHVRGYISSSRAYNNANFCRFQEKALRKYTSMMSDVVRLLVIATILKYPIGIISLPLTGKFGLNTPVGGFLEAHQVEKLLSVLKEEEVFLVKMAETDANVQSVRTQIEALPDITQEEFQRQVYEENLSRSSQEVPLAP